MTNAQDQETLLALHRLGSNGPSRSTRGTRSVNPGSDEELQTRQAIALARRRGHQQLGFMVLLLLIFFGDDDLILTLVFLVLLFVIGSMMGRLFCGSRGNVGDDVSEGRGDLEAGLAGREDQRARNERLVASLFRSMSDAHAAAAASQAARANGGRAPQVVTQLSNGQAVVLDADRADWLLWQLLEQGALSSEDTTAVLEAVAGSAHGSGPPPVDEAALNALPVGPWAPPKEVEAGDEAPACSVCLEALEPGVEVLTLPCAHVFHASCITPWLRQRGAAAECPQCRHPAMRAPDAVGDARASDEGRDAD